MADTIIKNNQGVALLITLAVITLLIAVGLEINRKVRDYVSITYTSRNQIALTQLAASGTQVAMAMLIKDRQASESDSLLEDWADPEEIALVLADLPFENGQVSIKISDELSRIQLNALVQYPERRHFNVQQQAIWDQLLRAVIALHDDFEEIDPPTIINSAKDWIDSGDDDATTGLTGAESDYYEGLDPPYASRNGPFLHTSELAFVRGVSTRLLFGTADIPGISDQVTVFGLTGDKNGKAVYNGRINLNTANTWVLAAMLPVEYTDRAGAIDEYRQLLIEADNVEAFQDRNWYKEAPGCSDVEINPELITTSSDLFRIEVSAALNENSLITETIIQREKQKKTGKWICKTLRWEAK